MSGVIPAPPSVATADGSHLLIGGLQTVGNVPTVTAPGRADWTAPGGVPQAVALIQANLAALTIGVTGVNLFGWTVKDAFTRAAAAFGWLSAPGGGTFLLTDGWYQLSMSWGIQFTGAVVPSGVLVNVGGCLGSGGSNGDNAAGGLLRPNSVGAVIISDGNLVTAPFRGFTDQSWVPFLSMGWEGNKGTPDAMNVYTLDVVIAKLA